MDGEVDTKIETLEIKKSRRSKRGGRRQRSRDKNIANKMLNADDDGRARNDSIAPPQPVVGAATSDGFPSFSVPLLATAAGSSQNDDGIVVIDAGTGPQDVEGGARKFKSRRRGDRKRNCKRGWVDRSDRNPID